MQQSKRSLPRAGPQVAWEDKGEPKMEGKLLPQQVSFEIFQDEAVLTPLKDHGRVARVAFHDHDCGFVDAMGTEGLRQAHRAEVSNALYANSPGAPAFIARPLPSPQALASYPELEQEFPEAYEMVLENSRKLAAAESRGDPQLVAALAEIVHRISKTLPDLREPISMYVAGGVAINLYTGYRGTMDVDAFFSHRLLLPPSEELIVAFEGAEGPRVVHFDAQYNPTLALLHPDYDQNAVALTGRALEDPKIRLMLLSPVDLAVTKLSRWAGNDQEDIRELAKLNLITSNELVVRAKGALDYYVGNTSMLQLNLRDAVAIVNEVQRSNSRSTKDRGGFER